MKILIINYRYFVSGGPERYMFNLQELLQLKGHTVIPFSIRYSSNVKTEYSKYFVPALSNSEEVYYKDQTWNFASFIKTLERSFYSKDVYDSLNRLIQDHKPDYAVVLHYLRKLSPAVLVALLKHNIPFVVRISDFAMACPNAHLIRNGNICELCVKGNLWNSVKYKCVQDSYGASFVNYAATQYHYFKRYYEQIPRFIVPSNFTMEKMIEAGWNKENIRHVPTFVVPNNKKNDSEKNIDVIYIGRIEYIKGVHIILEALLWIKENHPDISVRCSVVGSGNPDYLKEMKSFASKHGLLGITFTGNIEKKEVFELLSRSNISVVPSLWYDNMPNSVLESLSEGVPVIASGHGSLPEIVVDGMNGLLFVPNDAVDLGKKIVYILKNKKELHKMSMNAIKYVKNNHSSESHYNRLMEIYNELKDR